MTIERVSIKPSQLLLRATDGSIKFNTDTQFIKTDPTGTLYAGGYARAPCIYGLGTSNIFDHLDGGEFVPELVDRKVNFLNPYEAFYFAVPKATNVTYRQVNDGGQLGYNFTGVSTSNLLFYSYDDKTTTTITSINFSWNLGSFYYPSSGDQRWLLYPTLNSNSLPEVTSINGGLYRFPFSGYLYVNWVDSAGSGQTANNMVDLNNVYYRRAGIFTQKPPVALSLAVTP